MSNRARRAHTNALRRRLLPSEPEPTVSVTVGPFNFPPAVDPRDPDCVEAVLGPTRAEFMRSLIEQLPAGVYVPPAHRHQEHR